MDIVSHDSLNEGFRYTFLTPTPPIPPGVPGEQSEQDGYHENGVNEFGGVRVLT